MWSGRRFVSREWRMYLQDMIECCGRTLEYTDGVTREEFGRHGIAYDATVRKIGIDDDILWDIVRNKTAALKAALQELDRRQS